jgi:hypothetical protein
MAAFENLRWLALARIPNMLAKTRNKKEISMLKLKQTRRTNTSSALIAAMLAVAASWVPRPAYGGGDVTVPAEYDAARGAFVVNRSVLAQVAPECNISEQDVLMIGESALWLWHVNFNHASNSVIRSCLAVRVNNPLQPSVLLVRATCKGLGDGVSVVPSPDGNVAHFAPNSPSVLSCPFDLADALSRAGWMVEPDQMYRADFWMNAIARPEMGSGSLIAHPDFELTMNRDALDRIDFTTRYARTGQNGAWSFQSAHRLLPHQISASPRVQLHSELGAKNGGVAHWLSTFEDSPDYRFTEFEAEFMSVQTAPTAMVIGQGFAGTMERVLVDPGGMCCRGG